MKNNLRPKKIEQLSILQRFYLNLLTIQLLKQKN